MYQRTQTMPTGPAGMEYASVEAMDGSNPMMEKAMPKTSISVKLRRSSCLYPSFAISTSDLVTHYHSRHMFLPSTAASSSVERPAAPMTDDCRRVSAYDGAAPLVSISNQERENTMKRHWSRERRKEGKERDEMRYVDLDHLDLAIRRRPNPRPWVYSSHFFIAYLHC